jgi:ATP-binding cassette subfamily B (MDR/TAP) protein 1
MKAFETIDVSEANFFSLMFFVVALANFVIYAVAGWVCNEIGQVSVFTSLRHTRLTLLSML